jgi:tetratricopeptide (TPR) repeat protein
MRPPSNISSKYHSISHAFQKRTLMNNTTVATPVLDVKPLLDLEQCKALHFDGKLSEAEPAYSALLAYNKRILGEKHVETLKVLGNFSMLHLRLGNLDIAEKYCRDTIDGFIAKKANDRLTLGGMSNLAGILSAKKQYTEAEGLYNAVLKVQTQSLGEFHADTLATSACLARNIASQGQLEKSLDLLRSSLTKHQKTLGLTHPDSLSLAEDIYFVLYELGKHDEAEEVLRLSYQQRKDDVGEDAKITLEAASDLGSFLHMRGKTEEAEAILQDTLAKQRVHIGDMAHDTLTTMNRLGAVHLTKNNREEAEKILLEAHENQCIVLGVDHPETLSTVRKLALLRTDQGRLDEAEKLYRDIYTLSCKLYGDREHVVMLALKDLLESSYVNGDSLSCDLSFFSYLISVTYIGKTDEAIHLQEKLVGDLIQTNGPEHFLSVKEMGSLGIKYFEQDKLVEAEKLLHKSYDGIKALHGDGDVETQRILAVLADVKYQRGDVGQAEVMYRIAMEGLQRNLGTDSTEYLSLALKFTSLLNKKDSYMEAVNLGQIVFESFSRTLGFTHDHTLSSMWPYIESLVNSGIPGAVHQALALLRHVRAECVRDLGAESEAVQRIDTALKDIAMLMAQ